MDARGLYRAGYREDWVAIGIEADVLHNLAYLAQAQGHYQLAANLYKESLALFSKQGNEQGVAKCRAGLAAVAGVGEEVERGV
jgi:hypothetical protein